MKRIVFFIVGALLFLSSCSKGLEDFKINSCSIDKIDNMSLTNGLLGSRAYITVEYSNPSSREFDVVAIVGKAYLPSGKKLGRIILPKDMVVHIDKKCVKKVQVPLEIIFNNPLSLLAKSLKGELNGFDDALIDVSISVKTGLQTRTFEKNGITIEQFIDETKMKEGDEK